MRRWVASPAYRVVIQSLVAARKEAGQSQRQLAGCLGKPPSWVAKIEMGERRADIVEVVKISKALGLDPADFLVRVAAALPDELDI